MDRIRSGELPAELAFVISNNSRSGALDRARTFGAPAHHVSALSEGGEAAAAARMLAIVKERAIDLLVLAGYMKKVPEAVLSHLKNRVVNIHPALLPAFGGSGFFGRAVHAAVVARGCQYSGMTVHMVDAQYDDGQILLQQAILLGQGWNADAVGAAVLKLEHAWYWRVIRGFALGEIKPTAGDEPGRAVDLGDFPKRMHGHGD